MALVQCPECGSEISSDALACPKCGKQTLPAGASTVSALIGLGLLAGAGWFLLGGGLESLSKGSLGNIQKQVAEDAVAQYRIAAGQGNRMQKCVQAGFVAAAYLQAQDSMNYNLWKATEQADCAVAGLPR
jgi:hypothetical protein